jgi:signal transduction histidine kinase/pSer/pThr/pTyr-binding forkhead associated (FHA) protein/ActR/RegA family two-component response regulator
MTRLYMLNGEDEVRFQELEGDTFYLGRAPDNEICVNDKHVSRRHLKISLRQGKFFVEDLHSRNGTFVRDKMIPAGQAIEVKEGVPIAAGSVFFSLGRPYNRDIGKFQKAIDPSNPLNDTADMDRPKTSLRNLQLIYKVSRVLMQSLDINEVLEQILDHIFELLKRIDRGVILLVDERSGEISETVSRSKRSLKESERVYSLTVVKRVLRDGKAVIMTNTVREDRLERSESMELMKIKSVMCVPLTSRSKVRGAIYVDSVSKPYGFRKEDLSLLTALSSPAAIAIENAMLYADLERRVDERTCDLLSTQAKLRESEARFEAMFDHMSSGVVVYRIENGDFVIVNINAAYEGIEKVSKRNALGKSYLDVCPHYKDTAIEETLRRVARTGSSESGSLTFTDGEEIAGWRDYYAYRLPSGEVVVIFDDVTERKRAERDQRALQEQLVISQKMESIGAFAGGIAHNFRNILQAVSGNTEFLEFVCGDKQEIAELTTNIYDSVEKGVDLINNLLHFSRRGGVEYRMSYLDMKEVILQTHEIISRVFNKNIDIQVNVDPALYVKGNRSLLSQVFMNLYSNASDAMPNGGSLLIDAVRKGGEVLVTVKDTGIGMDEETLKKIFDPFFTMKEVGKGTGLGLATVHGIIEEHKGAITVSSKLGKGTIFRISLPYAEAAMVEEIDVGREIILGKGERVLIVDDERPALDALAAIVKKLGYEAIAMEQPTDALKTYSEIAPDVVIMDRGMPKMDGVTCAKKIVERDPLAKIIIVSGYEETGPNGIDANAKHLIKGYLTKPCKMEDLSEAISRALAASG